MLVGTALPMQRLMWMCLQMGCRRGRGAASSTYACRTHAAPSTPSCAPRTRRAPPPAGRSARIRCPLPGCPRPGLRPRGLPSRPRPGRRHHHPPAPPTTSARPAGSNASIGATSPQRLAARPRMSLTNGLCWTARGASSGAWCCRQAPPTLRSVADPSICRHARLCFKCCACMLVVSGPASSTRHLPPKFIPRAHCRCSRWAAPRRWAAAPALPPALQAAPRRPRCCRSLPTPLRRGCWNPRLALGAGTLDCRQARSVSVRLCW